RAPLARIDQLLGLPHPPAHAAVAPGRPGGPAPAAHRAAGRAHGRLPRPAAQRELADLPVPGGPGAAVRPAPRPAGAGHGGARGGMSRASAPLSRREAGTPEPP